MDVRAGPKRGTEVGNISGSPRAAPENSLTADTPAKAVHTHLALILPSLVVGFPTGDGSLSTHRDSGDKISLNCRGVSFTFHTPFSGVHHHGSCL